MKTLKEQINRYMHRINAVLVIVIFLILVFIQFITEQKHAYEDAVRIIIQINSVLEENQRELEDIQEEYRQNCLHNAETVAYMIQENPEVLNSVDRLKEIAAMVEIDEIHVFDKSGRIFAGTHPEYYNLTLDSGEQISYFKPMLEDKSLKLVQDITPNTAEEKLMQYSAVWSDDEELIVQVGMEPVNVMKVTKKNELSYIFSLLRVNTEVSYYAVDADSKEIVGSTNLNAVGIDVNSLGFDLKNVSSNKKGFHIKVNNQWYYCVFKKIGNNYIGRVVSAKNLYQSVVVNSCWILASLVVVVFFLAKAVVRYMNRDVVSKIDDLNVKLKDIAHGNLEENVDIQSSVEFAELSSSVNSMVKSLLDNNKKMSYVLSKTNMFIGTYEYKENSKKVRYTEYIPKIMSVEEELMEKISSDVVQFKIFINEIKEQPVESEQGVYEWKNRFIRLEENIDSDSVFGVAVDVTAEITKRMEAEKERDVDVLTGLYNRRGMDKKLQRLLNMPEDLGYSGVVMIDSDDLKKVNDNYGHEKGDIYLKEIARVISDISTKNSIASRQGGDEFVVFMYGYDNSEELMFDIERLKDMQSERVVALDENIDIKLRFSMGYCLAGEEIRYQELLMEADRKMYENKAQRKKLAGRK